jgi:hypothetical protein
MTVRYIPFRCARDDGSFFNREGYVTYRRRIISIQRTRLIRNLYAQRRIYLFLTKYSHSSSAFAVRIVAQ